MARKSKFKKLVHGGLLLLGISSFGYGLHQWENHLLERGLYMSKSIFNLNSVNDEARMARICLKLDKLSCRYKSLTKAYKMQPQNETLTGEYAIALSDVKQHDKAIMVFQKYFTVAQGTVRHHVRFARSLAQQDYLIDSKDWYYKALKESPQNLALPVEFIKMLRSNQQYAEALSIIGHYNLSTPKTRKLWAKMKSILESDYKGFQQSYQEGETQVSKIGQYFFAPGTLDGALGTQLFIVKPESDFTSVDIDALNATGAEYKVIGNKTVSATNGQELKGQRVILSGLIFGGHHLKDVEAIACENCAFVAGKSVLKSLKVNKSKLNNARLDVLSISKK